MNFMFDWISCCSCIESGEASPSFAPCWHCLQPEHAGHLYGTLCMLSVPLVQMSMSSFLDFDLFSYSVRCVSELSNVIKLVWTVLAVILGIRVVFCSRQLHKKPAAVLRLSYLLVS